MARFGYRRLVVIGLLTLALPGAARGQPLPIGAEFQINSYTAGVQYRPAVAGAGNFVAVWSSNQDGDGFGVFAQRYDSAGAPIGSECQVNSYTVGGQFYGGVASDAAGKFVVAWVSDNFFGPSRDGSAGGVFAQRFDSTGTPIGSEFQVNSYTIGNQGNELGGVKVCSDTGGDFVVVWASRGQDGDNTGVFGQRYASSGVPLGGEFQTNSFTLVHQEQQDIACDADGDFVVAWKSWDQDGYGNGVFAQRYASDGSKRGSEFQVNSYTLGGQGYTLAVAAESNGDFVVAWNSGGQGYYQDGDYTGVFGQRFASSGARTGTEFQVNTYTVGYQGYRWQGLDMASDLVGDFVVVWGGVAGDYGDDVFARYFAANGVPQGPELRVNSYTLNDQRAGGVAAVGGDFLVVWETWGQDGSDEGVFSQRLRALALNLDHFQCYRANDLEDPPFEPRIVVLDDQFETKYTVVGKPFTLCNPTEKNGEPVRNASDHLTCYKIRDAQPQAEFSGAQVEVQNQFGTIRLEVRKPYLLCVPSAKTVSQ